MTNCICCERLLIDRYEFHDECRKIYYTRATDGKCVGCGENDLVKDSGRLVCDGCYPDKPFKGYPDS